MTTDYIPQPDPTGWALFIESLSGERVAIAWYDTEHDARIDADWINHLSSDEMKTGPDDTWQWVEVRPMTRARAASFHPFANKFHPQVTS